MGVWAAPGRVNLIGEHTDYNDGFVLPLALAQRTRCAATLSDDGRIEAYSVQAPGEPVSVALDELAPGVVTGWGAYVAGTVWALRAVGHPVGGLRLLLDSEVPLGAGLSSSAALSCVVGLAATAVHGLDVPRTDLALAAQRAEHAFAGAPVGIMDQLAVLHGRAGHAVLIDTRSLRVSHVPLRLHESGLALLVIDTRAPHRLADGAYADRRRACERAASALGVPALRDASPAAVAALADPLLRRRATHVVTENARVLAAASVLAAATGTRDAPAAADADPRVIGRLLTASHVSLRDDFEVSSPELDLAVDTALAAGAHGARMTGGGFGGSAIALVDKHSVPHVTAAVATAFATAGLTQPTTFTATPSDGASRHPPPTPRVTGRRSLPTRTCDRM